MQDNIIGILLGLPLLGALLVLLLPNDKVKLHKYFSSAVSVLSLLCAGWLLSSFDTSSQGYQFYLKHSWLNQFNIFFEVGLDGFSLSLVFLTNLLFVLCVFGSYRLNYASKAFYSLLLLLQGTILGTISSIDLFLFFSFWVASLVPIYFITSMWGSDTKESTGSNFFLFQLFGAIFILIGIILTYYSISPHSFSLLELAGGKFAGFRIQIGNRSLDFEHLVFCILLFGFAIRLPIIPLHFWFIDIQVKTPPVLSVILGSLFIKTGAYGLVRLCFGIFPEAAHWMARPLLLIGLFNFIYAGVCALRQVELRRFVAYSCVSQMGLILMGFSVFSQSSISGAILQIITHGTSCALLLFLIIYIEEGVGSFKIEKLNLSTKASVLTGFFLVGILALLGTPGLGSFFSASLVLLGIFSKSYFVGAVSLFGMVITAAYTLRVFKILFLTNSKADPEEMRTFEVKEKLILVPLLLMIILSGVFPAPLIKVFETSVNQIMIKLGDMK